MQGELLQRLEAAPYRGKRVRVRAAVRVEGEGTLAYAWLTYGKQGGGLSPLVVVDTMADRPIRSPEWTEIELVGEIPEGAATVGYGFSVVGDGRAWFDSVSIETVEE